MRVQEETRRTASDEGERSNGADGRRQGRTGGIWETGWMREMESDSICDHMGQMEQIGEKRSDEVMGSDGSDGSDKRWNRRGRRGQTWGTDQTGSDRRGWVRQWGVS